MKNNNNNNSKKEPRKDVPDVPKFPIPRIRNPRRRRVPNRKKRNQRFQRARRGITRTAPVTQGQEITNIQFRTMKYKNNVGKSKILDYLLNPYKMVLDAKYFSIFPSQMKVIRLSLYHTWKFNTAFRRMLWWPYGVGFTNLVENYKVRISNYNVEEVATHKTNAYSNFAWIEALDGNSYTTHTVPTIGIIGKYRVIGASLKITNVSSLATKGGTVYIARDESDKGYPGYTYNDALKSVADVPDFTNDANIMYSLHQPHDNVSIKRLYSCTESPIINEVNIHEGNAIFNSSDEYLQAAYIPGNVILPVNTERLAYPQETTTGINVKYFIELQANAQQSYMVESWTVLELSPDPNSSAGFMSMAQDSNVGANAYMKQVIYKSDCLTVA